VWQCRRTTEICRDLQIHSDLFRKKTGLPVDAYFSGTKIKWILENVPNLQPETLLFGTIDTWLIWNLTGGKVHATDFTNASRTLIFNIQRKEWDVELCKLLEIPMHLLPEVRPSGSDFGKTITIPAIDGVPVVGVAGDQQAALFGQICTKDGDLKNTYGTGCFLVLNTGNRYIESQKGLITTLAIDADCKPCFALEGSVFIAGAAIQWLRDEMKLIEQSADSEAAALAVDDNGGVYFVPAFVGLGAPHWDSEARGTIVGLTRGTNRNHLIRAALESMAYQTYDILKTMETETGLTVPKLFVDGGASSNNFLMQFQADIIDRPVVRPANIESTALGAAFLAGLATGYWHNLPELIAVKHNDRTFLPAMNSNRRTALLAGWQKALRQTMTL
jgi:glycerol kinase